MPPTMSNRELIEAINTFVETYSDMSARTDEVLGLHSGTDKEITLTLTMLKKAADALSAYEWQPIETAPKDGTEVILCANGSVVTAWYCGETCLWPHDEAYSEEGEACNVGMPTHWMPLPPKPITGDE